ncbi:hypothetical protein ABZZ44_30450 [Streptomyces sp. NPDC006460]|uniref:hypothetical protein n=1 Tax=Streptomyces sp. NPDC006460 TaxID=3154304 RepID=UPI0033A0D53A
MDLEVIGALAAAGVALIGIPASILIGRWQMKAALRTAEATSRAGLAQAESAYRAALDAVRAQASAAHVQWRRGIQREAYASFLLAANRVQEQGERFATDNEHGLSEEGIRAGKATMDDALATLKAAQTIIELEGPDEVAAPAAGMADAAQMMGYHLGRQATYERAWGKLSRLTDDRTSDARVPATQLLEAFVGFRSRSGLDEPDGQAERACRDAWRVMPPGSLDDDEFAALLEGWSSRPPTSSGSYLDAVNRFSEAEARFIRAAKIELHSRSAP